MKKTLQVSVASSGDGYVNVTVVAQSDRGMDFGNKGSSRFPASNGIVLESSDTPEYRDANMVFVRGSQPREDKRAMLMPRAAALKLLEAVDEYNAFDFQKQQTDIEAALAAFPAEYQVALKNLLRKLGLPIK